MYEYKRIKELIWNVYRYDINKDEIITFNVFKHTGFFNSVIELFEKNDAKEKFSQELDREARYYFWSRYEYEVEVIPLNNTSENNKIKKIDIYDQLRLNWNNFIDYVWNNL